MLKKKKPVLKIIIFLIGFLFLLIFSEVLYALKNNSINNLFIYYHLFNIQKNLQKNDCEKVSLHLLKLSNNILRFNSNQYPGVYSSSMSASSFISVDELCKNPDLLINGLNRVDLKKDINYLHIKTSYIYYLLATQSEHYSDYSFPDILTVAIHLNPELSYYHVELANYYLLQGETSMSNNAIEFCEKFKSSKPYCQEYKMDKFENIGFLDPLIETYLLKFL